MPDEFPETRLSAIDAGPDSDPLEPPELSDELIDELLAGARTPEEITGPDGLLQRLTKRLVERAIDAELTEHLGYERGEAPPGGVGNARNGITPKTIHTTQGSVRLEQPRDRTGSFEPQIVPKHRGASPASTSGSSPCTGAGCRCVTSRRTWPSCTGLRSATT